ncbi:MAG: protein-tyrosine-phosphatase [Lewinellaceae bacterium]|nr:protein-tyrosine-phosphatase [Lewinellaceae bacterium]
MSILPALKAYLQKEVFEGAAITAERQEVLHTLADTITTRLASQQQVAMIFICTHNSRRSHLGQIWAAVAAAYYELPQIHTYSGGTEATAFNPRAVAALRRAGLVITNPGGENPHYQVAFAEGVDPLVAFSKHYADQSNPQHGFLAIMTCTDADEGCPVIPGAAGRFSLPYIDPKEADDTPQEEARYDERSRQIAQEMFFVFQQVKKNQENEYA